MSPEDDRFQKELTERTAEAVVMSGDVGVKLHGGPYDGRLIKSDAPMLKRDWYRTWPTSIAERFEPGFYALDEAGTSAQWTSLS